MIARIFVDFYHWRMIFLLNTTEKKRFNSTNDFPKIMFLSSTNFKKPGRTVDSIDSVTRVQSSTFITDGRFPILRRVKKKKKKFLNSEKRVSQGNYVSRRTSKNLNFEKLRELYARSLTDSVTRVVDPYYWWAISSRKETRRRER